MSDVFDRKITNAEYAGDYLEPGWHDVTVHQFEYDQNVADQEKPFVKITFRDKNGRGHLERFYITKAAMWRWVKFIMNFGIKEDDVLSVREAIHRIKDKRVRIQITKRETTAGGSYNNIKTFEPIEETETEQEYEYFQTQTPKQEKPQPDPEDFIENPDDPF